MNPRALTPELKDEVCRRIADGATVREFAAQGGMPGKSTIFAELRRDPEFADAYAKARELQLESWEDELVAIADDVSRDVMKRPDGGEAFDHEHIARSKLRVNTRQWIMSKRLPRRYGDRVAQELSGPEGGPIKMAEVSDLEVARRIAFLLEKGRRALEEK
jgi:hypothetical protein